LEGLSFTFSISSFLPSLLHSRRVLLTVMSQVAYEEVFKFQDPQVYLKPLPKK